MRLPFKRSQYLAGIAFMLACLPVLAEDLPWYAGGSFGGSKFDADSTAAQIDSNLVAGGLFTSASTTTRDDGDSGLKGYFGYNFSKYFGGEFGFISPGQPSMQTQAGGQLFTGSVDVSGWFAEFVATLPLGAGLSVHAKVGPFAWRRDATLNSTTTATSIVSKGDGVDFTAGIGLGYAINEQFGARLEFERFQFGDDEFDYLSAGLLVRF